VAVLVAVVVVAVGEAGIDKALVVEVVCVLLLL